MNAGRACTEGPGRPPKSEQCHSDTEAFSLLRKEKAKAAQVLFAQSFWGEHENSGEVSVSSVTCESEGVCVGVGALTVSLPRVSKSNIL